MYKPSALLEFLTHLDTRPKKNLSQNFLIDGNILHKIIEVANVEPCDFIVEIGAGPGALTQALLQRGAYVVAIEKDPILAAALYRFSDKNLQVIAKDVLNVDLQEIVPSGKRAKVIANLPYHITTPILTSLAPRSDLLHSITVMVQKEVAERMTASPGGRIYGSLTIFLSYFAHLTYAFTVSKNSFFPSPKVDSAVTHLRLKQERAVVEEERFFTLTRAAFAKRRKMLRSSLRKLYALESIDRALQYLQINPFARPEELSLQEFIQLFELLIGEQSAISLSPPAK